MYTKDILTIVTIPNYSSFNLRTNLIKMYNSVFQNNTIYVVEKMTNVLSAYIKEELNIPLNNFKKGLTVDSDLNIGIYKCDNNMISDVYNEIVESELNDYYLCIDPGVLVFGKPISKFVHIPFKKALGARLLATEPYSYLYHIDPMLHLRMELLYKDFGPRIDEDFCSFSNIKYKKEQYGVLLCRREFLHNVGGFGKNLNSSFVNTTTNMSYLSGYDVDYSHDLYTIKLKQEGK